MFPVVQTKAEQRLIAHCQEITRALNGSNADPASVIDVGAAGSVVIEDALRAAGLNFVCDRTDVADPTVSHPNAGRAYQTSVESMPMVGDGRYDLAFANFVFEHVADLDAAASELWRILRPGGHLVATIPNPGAPEFLLSRITPRLFHEFVRGRGEGRETWHVEYAYRDIEEFIRRFAQAGFHLVSDDRYVFTIGYLYRFPVINYISRLYDAVATAIGWKVLKSHACLVLAKR